MSETYIPDPIPQWKPLRLEGGPYEHRFMDGECRVCRLPLTDGKAFTYGCPHHVKMYGWRVGDFWQKSNTHVGTKHSPAKAVAWFIKHVWPDPDLWLWRGKGPMPTGLVHDHTVRESIAHDQAKHGGYGHRVSRGYRIPKRARKA